MHASRLALCAAGIGAALAFGAAPPALAAPPMAAGLAAGSAAPQAALVPVAARKHANKHAKKSRHSQQRRRGYAPQRRDARPVGGYDNVGSVGQDGYGYGYNRFSGQRYQSCVFDEGYGRTQPCDAGGGGGSRN
jgi:hypothetical protein